MDLKDIMLNEKKEQFLKITYYMIQFIERSKMETYRDGKNDQRLPGFKHDKELDGEHNHKGITLGRYLQRCSILCFDCGDDCTILNNYVQSTNIEFPFLIVYYNYIRWRKLGEVGMGTFCVKFLLFCSKFAISCEYIIISNCKVFFKSYLCFH